MITEIDAFFAAERRLGEAERDLRKARRAIVEKMNPGEVEALASVSTFLHLQDGMRGANGACRAVVDALAPWAKDLEADTLFGLFVEEDDTPDDESEVSTRKGSEEP